MRMLVLLLLLLVARPTWCEEKSLYLRLGGYDAIAAVTDDFLGRMRTDPTLKKYFLGHSRDSLQRTRQHVVDQLVSVTGGPALYKGRDMETAHKGLMITKDEWNISLRLLTASLDKYHVPTAEKQEVLSIVSSLEDEIVESKR